MWWYTPCNIENNTLSTVKSPAELTNHNHRVDVFCDIGWNFSLSKLQTIMKTITSDSFALQYENCLCNCNHIQVKRGDHHLTANKSDTEYNRHFLKCDFAERRK